MTSTRVVGFIPASGGGGTTMDCSRRACGRLGIPFVELENPGDLTLLSNGAWAAGLDRSLLDHCDPGAAEENHLSILIGHCMGGLSAYAYAASRRTDEETRRVGVVMINTPYPKRDGSVPSLAAMSDRSIGQLLETDGLPSEVLGDAELLRELASDIRTQAGQAEGIAREVSGLDASVPLRTLATRDDPIIRTAESEGWWRKSAGTYRHTVLDGGHSLSEAAGPVLEAELKALFEELS